MSEGRLTVKVPIVTSVKTIGHDIYNVYCRHFWCWQNTFCIQQI